MSRPRGWPTPADFRVVEAELPEPGPGQLLVQNLVMSLDPGMRPRMNDAKSYAPPYGLGEPLEGGAVGRVVESAASGLEPGDLVRHHAGWRESAVIEASAALKVDAGAAPASAYLGVLGMPGLTAYAGLRRLAEIGPDDSVWVSAAAGAVGQIAGQLAKIQGASRVIGSAGSAEKASRLVTDFGFDEAFNYKDAPVREQLGSAAPEGVDVYFDNVGGDHLEAALAHANVHARFVICGAMSGYNAAQPPPGPRNLGLIIGKRLQLRGLLVLDHADLQDEFLRTVAPHVASGRLRYEETVFDGLDSAPSAFLSMLRGDTTGKTLVRLSAA